MSLTVPNAEWLKEHAGKQAVSGSIPGGGIHYHFEFFAYFSLITTRRCVKQRTRHRVLRRTIMDVKPLFHYHISFLTQHLWCCVDNIVQKYRPAKTKQRLAECAHEHSAYKEKTFDDFAGCVVNKLVE